MFLRLWRDETGVVNSMDLILITTILVLGMIVGLVCLRNQVVQELSDTADAIGAINQSYSYNERSLTWGTFVQSVAGSSYTDQPNVVSQDGSCHDGSCHDGDGHDGDGHHGDGHHGDD